METRSRSLVLSCVLKVLGRLYSIYFSTFQPAGSSFSQTPERQATAGYCDRTVLGEKTMVPNAAVNDISEPTSAPEERRPAHKTVRIASSQELACPSRVACIRQQFGNAGVSQSATDLIIKSWRAGTNKQYAATWKQYGSRCDRQQVNPFQASIGQIADFLVELFDSGRCNSTINSYRAAPSSVLQAIDGQSVDQHPIITRLLRGMFNERSAVSRYNNTWDGDIVLQYLKTLRPVGDLSLKLLTLKLNALLTLVSAQRVQTLVSLSTASMAILPDRVKFTVTSLLKTSRPTKGPVVIQVLRFTESEPLCPYCACWLKMVSRHRHQHFYGP